MTDQYKLLTTICANPRQFAWFLGAGTSAVAGLPTAWDVMWDLKRRYYCREENQDISRQDVQIEAIRARIQSYMAGRGFPQEGAPSEYTTYFELIFGEDRERQRQYLKGILSEDKVTLSIGNRVLGALLATGRCRAVFTTNFDTVVERAVAEVSGKSLMAHHLEGATSANAALNNDEFSLYCKLHGDFRYDSIKNLSGDLARQNQDLSKALLNAANRFGLIVAGYSGRDDSVMELLHSALKTHNPFPHGLFWTGMKGAPVLPSVTRLIQDARDAGVEAAFVEVETFDAFMIRLWRNMPGKEPEIDAKVKVARRAGVSIPMPATGKGAIVRMNALPIVRLPGECQALSFKAQKEWSELRAAAHASEGHLILTKADNVLCWGREFVVRSHFPDVESISPRDIKPLIDDRSHHLYLKGFLEEALCRSLAQGKPLLVRTTKYGSFLIANAHARDQGALSKLHETVGKPFGQIAGLTTAIDEDHPEPERVFWAEAARVSIEFAAGRSWMVIDPEFWIWPPRARRDATRFMNDRRAGRYNSLYNSILEAWFGILFDSEDPKPTQHFRAFSDGSSTECPAFEIGTRTTFTRRRA
jgi:hypothetical protein